MSTSSGRKLGRALLPALPCLIFLICFFCIPVIEILQTGAYNADGQVSLEQFRRMGNDIVFAKVLWTTFKISGLTALFSVIIGFPVAYFLSQASEKMRNRWMIWLMIPFWTSYLVKTFAWILVLSKTGVLTSIAVSLGLVSDPQALAPSMTGVMIGMVHAMLPLAVINMLPIMQGVNINCCKPPKRWARIDRWRSFRYFCRWPHPAWQQPVCWCSSPAWDSSSCRPCSVRQRKPWWRNW